MGRKEYDRQVQRHGSDAALYGLSEGLLAVIRFCPSVCPSVMTSVGSGGDNRVGEPMVVRWERAVQEHIWGSLGIIDGKWMLIGIRM